MKSNQLKFPSKEVLDRELTKEEINERRKTMNVIFRRMVKTPEGRLKLARAFMGFTMEEIVELEKKDAMGESKRKEEPKNEI